MKNSIVLAFLGDAVYELWIRNYLVSTGIANVNDLQTETLKYVSANSQKKHLDKLMDNNFLIEKELDIIKKGRNAKGGKSKSADIVTYRLATGLESLFGQLYIENNLERINEIIEFIVGE